MRKNNKSRKKGSKSVKMKERKGAGEMKIKYKREEERGRREKITTMKMKK